jgi:hypothetical protein
MAYQASGCNEVAPRRSTGLLIFIEIGWDAQRLSEDVLNVDARCC